MDHKQDNVQSLFDEPSEPVSQSPSKCSIGNTEEPEENIHSNPPPPPPSPWKRAALIILICFLFYLGFSMRSALLRDKKHDVIYASRYSKEHKFRPAASPVITETLKDGRTRLRGSYPTPTTTATPLSTAGSKKRRRPGRAGGAKKKTRSTAKR
ncbi:hypothetical protein Ac2012v2_007108 [Leucoagaricus gongylophorus]